LIVVTVLAFFPSVRADLVSMPQMVHFLADKEDFGMRQTALEEKGT
jgi:hypothetical protein